jgi:pimeloyl-ACP methyl ester carboxylesterase
MRGELTPAQVVFFAPADCCMDQVALDFCGHGFSGRRQSLSYHDMDNLLDVVHLQNPDTPCRLAAGKPLTLLDQVRVGEALGWKKYSLLGHSYGGCVAQAVAAVVPERVCRLLALEALGFFSQV